MAIGIVFSLLIMMMLTAFCYKMIKEKDTVKRVDNEKEYMDDSGKDQETSETSSFVFTGQMTKI